MGSRRSCVSDR